MPTRNGYRWAVKPPPGTQIDVTHPASSGLVMAFCPHSAAAEYDALGNLWSPVNSPASSASTSGFAAIYDGTSNYHINTTLVLPTTSCTVALSIYVATSSSNGSSFGNLDATDPTRLQAHLPYSGTLYWDFGGLTGNNRVSWTPNSGFFGNWHRMVFRAGTRGTSIWSDGVNQVSSSTAISRSICPTGLSVGAWWYNGYYNPNSIELMLLSSREWTDAEIVDWTGNPYGMYMPPATRRFFSLSGSPAMGTFPWSVDLGVRLPRVTPTQMIPTG
jgi:hypothetical protein